MTHTIRRNAEHHPVLVAELGVHDFYLPWMYESISGNYEQLSEVFRQNIVITNKNLEQHVE